MGRRRRDEEDEDEDGGGEEAGERLVPQDLTDEEMDQARIDLANKTVELFDLEDKRTRAVEKTNQRIKDTKHEIRDLAQQLRTGVKMVPAQLQLEDAVKSRRAVQRSRQDNGAAVGAEP